MGRVVLLSMSVLLMTLALAPAAEAGIPIRCYPNPDALPQVHWAEDPDTGIKRPYVTYEPGGRPVECVY